MVNEYDISGRLKAAVRLHREGDLEAARRIYADVLEAAPQNPDALHLLGVIAYQQGDFETAATLISRAIELKPRYPVYYKNLGNAYKAMGQLEQAAAHFLTAIAHQPDYIEAYIDLGNTRQMQRQYPDAVDIYQKALALQPDTPDIYNNLGAAYQELGNWEKAIACLQAALHLQPLQKEAYNHLGNALQAAGHWDKAVECYRLALQHCGEHPKIWLNLGNVSRRIGKVAEAVECYRRALKLNPGYAKACNNLGNICKEQGDYATALHLYQKALSLEADNPDFHFNLGLLYHLQDNLDHALDCYRNAVELEPRGAEAHLNIGKIRHEQQAFDQALVSYDKAVRINPAYAEAHFNRSVTLLTTGQLPQGFQAYEWRFKCAEWQSVYPHRPDAPRWRGASFAGRRLLVFSEQGIGDTLQFMRYLPGVKARGGEVILETFPELLTLLKDCQGVDRLVSMSRRERTAENYDLQVPLMSLAAVFKTNLENIPAEVPYIHADPLKAQFWSRKIGMTGLRVGLVWAGKPDHKNDRRRSIPLEQLIPLLQQPGVQFIGLQKGPAASTVDRLAHHLRFRNLGDSLEDFSDTAAAIECLDLVVAVDTAVAHLAGAMGKAVWLLLPYTPDWRWLLDRSDSPWYPTMRLFRQPDPDNWPATVQTLCQALRALREARQNATLPADHGLGGDASGLNNSAGRRLASQATAIDEDNHRQNKIQLYLGLKSGSNYGWGVCSRYLIQELAKLTPIRVLNGAEGPEARQNVAGKLFQALTGIDFYPMFKNVRGQENYGYTFFENELNSNSLANAAKLDLVIAGSSWCRDRLLEKGIQNSEVLIQGVAPKLFYPIKSERPGDGFVIFSGGKFELRKGQDLVLRAAKIMQDKYADIILVNSWYNLWPQSIRLMRYSRHIRLPSQEFAGWTAFMKAVYGANGLKPDKIRTFELLPNEQLRELYRHTDLGIFPNRCEGGTNLVLMEYMACGKPVIASNTSGHKDIVTRENALLLDDLKNIQIIEDNRRLMARWQEPSLEELVAKMEYAYHHREEIRRIGQQAGADLKKFSWELTAKRLLGILGIAEAHTE